MPNAPVVDVAPNPCPTAPAPPSSLERWPAGAVVKVVDLEVDSSDARRLKALGLCAGRKVEVLASGDPLIVRVVGSRVGLSAELARHVLVSNC